MSETTKLLPAQNYEPIMRELEGTPMSNPTTAESNRKTRSDD